MPDEGVIEEAESTLGERLLIARESQGLSQQRVADELHLPAHYIDWIEKGDFNKLPSLVFAKGYIRGYAKMVGVDSEPLIADFNQSYGLASDTKTPIQSVSKVQEQVKLGDPMMRWSLRLFVIAILAASVWWWKTQYSLPEPTVSTLPTGDQTAQPVVASADGNTLILPRIDDNTSSDESASVGGLEGTGGLEGAGGSDAAETPQVALAQEAIAEDEPVDLTPEQIAALQKQLDAGQDVQVGQGVPEPELTRTSSEPSQVAEASATESLLIEFSGECWFSIKDAAGRVISTGIKQAGERVNLAKVGKISLTIGSAQAVERFSYHGKDIDLAKYTKGNVAKFELMP